MYGAILRGPDLAPHPRIFLNTHHREAAENKESVVDVKTMLCPNCGDRIKHGTKICNTCGEVLGAEEEAKEKVFHTETLFPCPICNKENMITKTFKCPSCESEKLCLDHRVKRSVRDPETRKFLTEYYCSNCWKKHGFATFSD